MVKVLLKAKADQDQVNHNGESPLCLAELLEVGSKTVTKLEPKKHTSKKVPLRFFGRTKRVFLLCGTCFFLGGGGER